MSGRPRLAQAACPLVQHAAAETLTEGTCTSWKAHSTTGQSDYYSELQAIAVCETSGAARLSAAHSGYRATMILLRRLMLLVGALEAARRYVRENPDKVNKFADRVGRFVDRRTKGRYHRQVDGAVRKIRSSTTKA